MYSYLTAFVLDPPLQVGHAIHRLSKRRGLAVIPYLGGHGIGTFFHGPPDIYHTLNNYIGKMEAGMVFTVEPCVTAGSDRRILKLEDGFTIVTADAARTAQFEHTVCVTEHGVELLSG